MVLYTKIANDNFTINDSKLIHFVSDERQEFIRNNKNDKTKLLSLYAELLLRYGLQHFYGLKDNISISKLPQGKPFLEELNDFDINISHTTNMVMCGINNTGKIGVDVEHKRNVHSNVEKKVYSVEEIAYINKNIDLKQDRFFEIWTKKEAYTKYNGTGLRFNLTDINMLSSEHTSKLKYWQDEDFYFSVYSDNTEESVKELSFEELSSYFLNL